MNALYRRPSSMPPSAPPRARVGQDGFVSDVTLEGWVRTGDAMRAGAQLTLADGARYVLTDALRILGRRNGETDPYGLTGRVETLRDFLRKGGVLSADAVRLGPAIYDAEYGVLALPCASADESGANPKAG